jgi:RNA polymerase sigma-70 factor, ECF subfamily
MTEKEFDNKIVHLRDKMYRFAGAIVADDCLAEDIVHDVMERMWLNRHNLDNHTNIEAFVMVSIRNACYDAMRHRRIMRNHDMLRDSIQDSIVEETAIWDMRKMLHKTISLLDERERIIIHLKDVEGYETSEIAEILSIQENNVRAILSRARREVRVNIEKIMNYGLKRSNRKMVNIAND